MNYDLENRLMEYRKIRDDIDDLKELLVKKEHELERISSDSVVVRFGDLLIELANMFKMNVEDIEVKIETGISFYGNYSEKDIISMFTSIEDYKNLRTNKNELIINICSKDKRFRYCFLTCHFDFDLIQADGKVMYEHLGIESRRDNNGNIYSLFVIDKGISDLILEIPLASLCYSYSNEWYPPLCYEMAVKRCAEKSINSTNKYVRSRAIV